jgi:hypothetical protein
MDIQNLSSYQSEASQPMMPAPRKGISPVAVVGIVIVVLALGYTALAKYQDLWPFADKTSVAQETPTPSPSPATASEWKTYTNTQYGFEFKYPADMTIDSTAVGGLTLVFTSSTLAQEKISYPERFVGEVYGFDAELQIIPTTYTSTQSLYASLQTEKAQNLSWIKVGSTDAVSFNARDLGNPLILQWIHNGSLFNFLPASKNPVLNQILSTFKFTGSTQASTWKTYTSTQYGFEVQYPQYASVSTSNQTYPTFKFLIPVPGAPSAPWQILTVMILTKQQYQERNSNPNVQQLALLAQNNTYVAVYQGAQECPEKTLCDTNAKTAEQIMTSFKFTK